MDKYRQALYDIYYSLPAIKKQSKDMKKAFKLLEALIDTLERIHSNA